MRRLQRNRLREHEQRRQADIEAEHNPIASTSTAPPPPRALDWDGLDASALGLDRSALEAAMQALPSESPVETILARNAKRLRRLQVAQWQRLRDSVGTSASGGRATAEEVELADEAVNELVGLVPLAGRSVIPSADALRAVAPSTNPADVKPAPFVGLLDPHEYATIREGQLLAPSANAIAMATAKPPSSSAQTYRSILTIPARAPQPPPSGLPPAAFTRA